MKMPHPWREPNSDEPLARRVRRYKIERYLIDQHCTLFPDAAFDLTDPKERAQAVIFLEQILDGIG